jgi:hypothetical protein
LVKLGRFAFSLIASLVASAPAFAQDEQPAANYTVDGAQGPVTGSTRVIGLGGAFVAIAESMDGVAVNPASVAVRQPYSWTRWDHSLGVHFAFGAWLPETNFLNEEKEEAEPEDPAQPGTDAEVEQRSLLFGSIGLVLYYDHAGIGVSAEGQRQALARSGSTSAGLAPTDLAGNFGIVHASIGYGFGRGQLVLGAGPRVTGVSLSRATSASGLLSVAGVGYQAGLVYKPLNQRFRIGATYKSEVKPSLGSGATSADQGAYNATAITLPWQASAGIAFQLGPREMNLPLVTVEDRMRAFELELEARALQRESEIEQARATYESDPTPINDERLARVKARARREEDADERRLETRTEQTDKALLAEYLARPRFYFLVTTELLMLGPTADGVGLGSLYQGRSRVRLSGENLTVSPRLGLETEVIPNWMKLRAGTYLEPARVAGSTDRYHVTGGFDLKLFRWNVFGLIGDFDSWTFSAAVDSAREYLSTSFTVGFWH